MPIFEYQCQACRDDFELLIRGAENGSVCPACGSKEIKRKFSVFGTKSSSGFVPSSGSSCGGCQSNSCAGCKH